LRTSPTPTAIRSTCVRPCAERRIYSPAAADRGDYATVAKLAVAEMVNASYLIRVLRLTLLAPDIVEAILGGQQTANMTLDRMLKPFAAEWEEQRLEFAPVL